MSVGSLTTTFTPPASCLASFSTIFYYGPLFAGPLTTQSCMPDNFQFSSTNFYSPGICPVGYTTACQTLNVLGTISETVVTCCPTSYICNTVGRFQWESTFACASTFSIASFSNFVLESHTTIPTATVSTVISGNGAVNALSVQIRYQSTDFRSPQTIPTSTTTIISITTATPTLSNNSSGSSGGGSGGGGGGIKPGAAAGIGIGSLAGALLLGGAFVLVYIMGRRRRLAENPFAASRPPERSNVHINSNIAVSELPARAIPMPEMPGY